MAKLEFNENTKIVIPLAKIAGILTFIYFMFQAYFSWTARLSTLEQNYVGLKSEVEKNRNERIEQINLLRSENNDQHALLMQKTEKIYDYLLKSKKPN